jgi:FMN-dependent NADH-azoreductase
MSNVLMVTCNSDTTSANLRRSGGDAIDALKQADPGVTVRERHLSARPLPAIDCSVADALRVRPSRRSAAQWRTVSLADMMLQETRLADVLLITAPLRSGRIPAELSAWMAHVGAAAKLAPDERHKHCATHDAKVALVVVDTDGAGAGLSELRNELQTSLAPLGVREAVIFETDCRGYPLRSAPVLLIVSRYVQL